MAPSSKADTASGDDSDVVSKSASTPSLASDASGPPVAKRKVLRRVRKNRDRGDEAASGVASGDDVVTTEPTAATIVSANMGADVWATLTGSRIYLMLLLLRFVLLFFTPATLEGTEFADGVDLLAAFLLPGVATGGADPQLTVPPAGLGEFNRTRSIVGAFITSGIPYMGVNIWCTKVSSICTPSFIAQLAVYIPRIWMFFLTLITDVLLVRCFAVYEGHNAQYALITYASTWTTLLAMPRNLNFALEAQCVTALVAACFGWRPNVARPVFWLSATALSLGIFLRPPFAFFVFTPIIYLSSLWGKSGIDVLRYVRAALEGVAIFAFWCTIWVSVDSVFFGTFKFRFGDTIMTSFDMFLEYCTKGLPFSYKGSLVYTPLNALRSVANRQFLSSLTMNTSPGQMFLSLPTILGPLFIVLLRVSVDGMKLAMKELMSELKQVANSKKGKKRKSKKGMTKELEDELYVYFDTIQTTFLLGLLIEVVQNHDRLGTLSLLSLIPAAVICIAGRVFGPAGYPRFRMLHIVFTVVMVLFYGLLNQAGIPRVMMRVGAGGMDSVPHGAGLVVYRGVIGHRSLLGANVKNVSMHHGGESFVSLMTKMRELKEVDGYDENNLLVLAAATVPMRQEFKEVETVAYGHMSVLDFPANVDDAVRKCSLRMYRFVGDEDEEMIRENEEAAEEEEREGEERMKREKKKREASGVDDL